MARVVNMGPWTGDPLQQQSQRHAAVQQLQAAGAQFLNDPNQAHNHADARGHIVVYIAGAQGGHGGSNQPIYASVDPANWGGGGGGGGGSGGGGAGGAPGAAPGAVQAGLPQASGQGLRFQRGAANVTQFLPSRADTFDGHDSFTPPEHLSKQFTPLGINWDSFARYGSFCVRRGSAKMNEDIDDLQITEGSITVVANTDLTASTDYITFTLPGGDTHAFWFDTTGSDSEPAGSSAATNSTRVLTNGSSASDVANQLAEDINTADIGIVAIHELTTDTLRVFAVVGGATWGLTETVTDAGFTVTAPSDGALDSSYRGISISRIPGNSDGPDLALLSFADGEIGDTPDKYPQTLHVVKIYPAWGRPLSLDGWPGPKLALTEIAGPEMRVTTDYTNVFNNSTEKGKRAQSVVKLIVRYSTTGYPTDPDGEDWLKEMGATSTALVDRASWTGASRNDDTNGNAFASGTTIYVTAWAVTRTGYSNPSYASETIA